MIKTYCCCQFFHMYKECCQVFVHFCAQFILCFLIYVIIFLVILQSPKTDFPPGLRPLSPELGKRQRNCKMKFKCLRSSGFGLFHPFLETSFVT